MFTSDIGTYEITLTKPGHLTYTVKNVEIINGINDLVDKFGVMELFAGDVNGDEVINEEDTWLISSEENFEKTISEAVNKDADLNGDGLINGLDHDIVIETMDTISLSGGWILYPMDEYPTAT